MTHRVGGHVVEPDLLVPSQEPGPAFHHVDTNTETVADFDRQGSPSSETLASNIAMVEQRKIACFQRAVGDQEPANPDLPRRRVPCG